MLLSLLSCVLSISNVPMILENSLQYKKIGSILRESRLEKDLTLEECSARTKINLKYLDDLERGNYESFESEVFIKGFLRNYSKFLGKDPDRIIALYRREYSTDIKNKQKNTNSSKDNDGLKKLFGRPIYLIAGVFTVILAALLITSQFVSITRAPELLIEDPIKAVGSESGSPYVLNTNNDRIELSGKTSANSIVVVNGTVVPTDPFYGFTTETIPLPNSENRIRITSTNQFGRETSILLTINRITDEVLADKLTVEIVAKYDTTMRIFRDNLPAINRSVSEGETFNIEAEKEIVIDIVDPESIEVIVNNNLYNLSSGKNTWRINDEGLVSFIDNN